MADNAKWFVIHTYSGYENKVASNIKTVAENRGLQDEILDVVIPSELVKEVKEDEPKERKLFPGYVFVKAVSYKKKEPTSSRAAQAMSEGNVDLYPSEYDEITTMSDEAWYVVRNTRGVTGFVGPDSKPSPLKDDELEALGLAVIDEAQDDLSDGDDSFIDIFSVRVEVDYSVGDRVNVISGPWEGQSGEVKNIDLEREVVTVSLHMMGRDTPTEFSLDEVELA